MSPATGSARIFSAVGQSMYMMPVSTRNLPRETAGFCRKSSTRRGAVPFPALDT